MSEEITIEPEPPSVKRKKPLRKPFPPKLHIKNSERLYEFLTELGNEFERSPEEQARELLVQYMIKVRNLQEEKK